MIGGPPRRILITGGNSGIGLALAKRLISRHELLLSGRKPKQEIEDLIPVGARYVAADQSAPEASAKALVDAIRQAQWDGLDNAVLNAGVGFAAIDGIDSSEAIRRTLDINLAAAIAQAQALYPYLRQANGTLTFVGSVVHSGSATIPAYAASKAGLHGLARALRSEWKEQIAVQVLDPGPTQTDIHDKAGYDPGPMRALFLPVDDMAAMMEKAIVSRRSPVTLSWLRYLAGRAFTGHQP